MDYRFQQSQRAEDKGACSQHAVGDFDSGIIPCLFHEHAVKRIREHGAQEKKISGCRKTGGSAGGKYCHEDTAKRDQNTGGLRLRRFFFRISVEAIRATTGMQARKTPLSEAVVWRIPSVSQVK